jgi:hypothetical protein
MAQANPDSLPTFRIGLPDLEIDPNADPAAPPSFPPAILCRLLAEADIREAVGGPERVALVVLFHGPYPTEVVTLSHPRPPEGENGMAFRRELFAIWNSFAVGQVVPVVLYRSGPVKSGVVQIAPLPWVPAAPYCERCGADPTVAGGAPHACPRPAGQN